MFYTLQRLFPSLKEVVESVGRHAHLRHTFPEPDRKNSRS